MKYALTFVFGVLTGLSFSRIPHYINQYADHSLPKPDWEAPKMTGNWSDEDRRTIEYYYGGGKN